MTKTCYFIGKFYFTGDIAKEAVETYMAPEFRKGKGAGVVADAAIVNIIQSHLYDDGGQDGWFEVVDTTITDCSVTTIVIFQIDPTKYKENENPIDLLRRTIKDVFGEECSIFKLREIKHFSL